MCSSDLAVVPCRRRVAANLHLKYVLHDLREKDKLVKTLGGIRDMSKLPAAVWVVDTKKEHRG